VTAYPVTAWAAINAAGPAIEMIADAVRNRRSGLRAREPGQPAVGWLDSPSGETDDRVSALVTRALAPMQEWITRARGRWGASRLGILLAVDGDAQDARWDAEGTGGDSLVDTIAQLTGARAPAYVRRHADEGGLAAVTAALRVIEAGFADVVLAGGVQTRGPDGAAAAGEGAAFVLVERQADALIEVFDVTESSLEASPWRSDLAYVHTEGRDLPAALSRVPVLRTDAITGHLGAAAGVTALALGAACLHDGISPDPAASLEGDHVLLLGPRTRLLVHARLS
jgi:hypothetical protein